jgi:diaminohydroxyphosphoribosylaminopyrimidine deaminase/5-amino-6-(5-phosphoribosylamino)uracil reductase
MQRQKTLKKMVNNDITYMKRCFYLARLGRGYVAPNPMVGCVVVAQGRIIGEGYHRQHGGPHAEVNALNSVKERHLLPQSTVYVNLEPCSHYGKTPPCADRLIKEGVKKVVVCNLDPNPLVAGRGIEKLRQAGIEVATGLLEQEGWQLNRRFFTFFTQHRPYIILKWAQTADGFLDALNDKPIRISTDITKALVHQMRAEEAAILVGTQTALKDNPSLHTRRWFGKHPLRIAIDRIGKIPPTHHLLDGTQATLILTETNHKPPYQPVDFKQNIIPQLLDKLYEMKIQSLIVEGGEKTLQTFIEGNYFDEIQVEYGAYCCHQGTPAPSIGHLHLRQEVQQIGDGMFVHYYR